MAITNEDIALVGNVAQNILLGTSTSFIVQNTSERYVKYKIKDTSVKGGVIPPNGAFSFATDMTFWVEEAYTPTPTSLYVIRD